MSATYSIPEHVLTRVLDGELVMLNLDSERYFGLDETGTRFWQVLNAHNNLDDVKAQLLDEFDVAPEQMDTDLRELVAELAAHGLLALREHVSG